MRRYYLAAAAALLALFIVACSLWPPKADARPLPAHHAVAGFGAGHCLPTGVWQATLTVTADVAGGTAHLQPQGVTGFDLPMPVSNRFTIGPNVATYTVTVTVSWPDGFVAAPMSVSATRPPDGCTVPTTSTTDCAHANPPRDDCATTTTEVTTSLPTTSTSVAIAIGSTSPSSTPTPTSGSSSTVTAPNTATSVLVRSSSTTPIALPTTGSSPWVPAGIAAGIALTGCALLLVTRRRAVER